MAGQLDEAAKQILGTLLADFTDRELSTNDLKKTYEGPKIEVLATAVCNIDDITKVDFEVAFADLEKANLVKTGPMEAYKNKPGGNFFVIASFSKREYAYLTENGYKAARKAPNRPQRVQRVVNNVHISGGHFSNMQLAAGENVQQSMSVSSGDSDSVSRLIAILEAQGLQVSNDQRVGIESAVSEAEQGNAGTAKSFLAKVCGPMWESLQPVMWPIVGEIVKKSMGF
ncbi:TPA: hypothetical protein ACJHGT_002778 [Yersinia enterocolitica]|uniref:hypothetical protein n=1 Tax=Yersinia TaxID=629 RepID=UPI0005E3F7E3|nr:MULTISPECIES: hypothetical protein [Yersinia]OVZ90743.1 hypothetical protein CBW58_15130 [Yersinia frederiksenii]EKN3402668.1 hypothetical protein [Yersinia enterocolitica]EKN3994580.1 hypothetical protein [Yersinia enterocolitica]EKN4829855.1 hypothetical protein [Yersinia enterocolitica]EKN4851096.1 hypothetical protein [Yersinia enterocolitica]